MLTLNDGRSELWQWDTGRTLDVDADCSQVHFSNKVFGRSIDVDVFDGAAIIPDVLLQTDKDLNVWSFVGTADNGYTKISKTFKVNRRNKPADYVFTPTDQMTLHTIQSQIGDLSGLTTEAKDTLVAAINEAARTGGGAGSMELRVADGYVQYSTDGGMTWTNLIAMAELKGANGITPTIGDNGNWYLGAADTGKPSRGETGAQGTPGVYYGPTQPTGDAHPVWIDPDGGPDDGGLLPAVTAADNGKVLRVVSSAWSAQEMPEVLPNPNALTFTGAVEGSYDGSAPLEVEIPSGGGSGSDISLGLTGAKVGQIAKITAVDGTGKPTAWAPVDMPSGGGETWEEINAITLSDAVNTVTINTDSGGKAIALKKVRILVEGSATHQQDLFFNNSRYIRAQVVGTAPSVGALSAEPFCGKMYCFAVTSIASNYASVNQTANIFSDEITITEIKLIVNNSGTFSAGTKFTIQGVRA